MTTLPNELPPEARQGLIMFMRALTPMMNAARANTLCLESTDGPHPFAIVLSVGPDAKEARRLVAPPVRTIGAVVMP